MKRRDNEIKKLSTKYDIEGKEVTFHWIRMVEGIFLIGEEIRSYPYIASILDYFCPINNKHTT